MSTDDPFDGALWETYEDFSSGVLSPSQWKLREVTAPDGSTWRYQDPGARITVVESVLEIRAPKFERGHDTIQCLDNAKVLILSERTFAVPPSGRLVLAADVAARRWGDDPADVRDGFAALNAVDFDTALIFDVAATGERHAAIYERLPRVGHSSFLCVIEAPFAAPGSAPGQWHRLAVQLDAKERSARWFVDHQCIYSVAGLPVMPSSVRIGPGLLTLRPLGPRGSTSVRGQGMMGRWRNFRVHSSG